MTSRSFLGLSDSVRARTRWSCDLQRALPDDDYRILLVGEGDTPLTNVDGQPFNMATEFDG